ncbi:hypothetical protein [Pseudomonas sp. QTF5]|uniref:hypothetical protein n=1 Tax=Pseudomonas sp. QTF5 TaxID=1435425 RepID=UPI00117A57FE|nr:hypothetical protein [Pseudomonas sp. QTF5]
MIDETFSKGKKKQPDQAAFMKRCLILCSLKQGRRGYPSADFQVINGVPSVDYRHLKAVGFALSIKFSARVGRVSTGVFDRVSASVWAVFEVSVSRMHW